MAWDETKRRRTLAEPGLDFADARKVFAGNHFTRLDDRRDYGEPRCIMAGYLERRFVAITWTPRDGRRRIISMRYGHGQEEERYVVAHYRATGPGWQSRINETLRQAAKLKARG